MPFCHLYISIYRSIYTWECMHIYVFYFHVYMHTYACMCVYKFVNLQHIFITPLYIYIYIGVIYIRYCKMFVTVVVFPMLNTSASFRRPNFCFASAKFQISFSVLVLNYFFLKPLQVFFICFILLHLHFV